MNSRVSTPHASKHKVAKQPTKKPKIVYTEVIQDVPSSYIPLIKKNTGIDISKGNTTTRILYDNGDMSSLANRKNHYFNIDCLYNKNKNESTSVFFDRQGITYRTDKEEGNTCNFKEVRKTKDLE